MNKSIQQNNIKPSISFGMSSKKLEQIVHSKAFKRAGLHLSEDKEGDQIILTIKDESGRIVCEKYGPDISYGLVNQLSAKGKTFKEAFKKLAQTICGNQPLNHMKNIDILSPCIYLNKYLNDFLPKKYSKMNQFFHIFGWLKHCLN